MTGCFFPSSYNFVVPNPGDHLLINPLAYMLPIIRKSNEEYLACCFPDTSDQQFYRIVQKRYFLLLKTTLLGYVIYFQNSSFDRKHATHSTIKHGGATGEVNNNCMTSTG
jgi:hypothetical protein